MLNDDNVDDNYSIHTIIIMIYYVLFSLFV